MLALGLDQGGFFSRSWGWSAIVLLLAGAVAASVRADFSSSRSELAAVALLAALTGWTALSALWSSAPSTSVDEATRTLVYLAAAVAVALLGGRRELPLLLAGVFCALAALTVYGLARYLFAAKRVFGFYEGFQLYKPIGYSNGFGLLAAVGALLALGLVVYGSRRARAAAGAALPIFVAALYLTSSRGAWLALAAGTLATLALDPRRGRVLAALLAAAPFCAAAVVVAARSDLLHRAAPFPSPNAGKLLALWLCLLALGAAAAIRASERLDLGRNALLGLAVGIVAAAVAVALRGGLAGQDRAAYWHVAWREYVAHPVLGSGAGTFQLYWQRERPIASGALDAHNLYLESLAELGPPGLALLAGALALPLAAAARARRIPLVPAAAGAFVAYVVHAAVDWDWELPAVTVAGLACGLAVLAAARGSGRKTPRTVGLWLVTILALAAFALVVRKNGY